MSTKDRKVHIVDKKFMTTDDFGPYFLGFLEKLSKDVLKLIYPRQGFFQGGVLSSSMADKVSISTPLKATDGLGNILNLDPSTATVPFENKLNVIYSVGLRYVALFIGTEVNVRTGQIEYRLIEDTIGEIAEPDRVIDQGTTLKVIVNSVTEYASDNSGRTVRVFLKRALGQADAFFNGVVQFDGTDNFIETTSLLGQTAGRVDTDASKYQAFLLGPTIRKVGHLRPDPNLVFVGFVTGTGRGNIPSVFNQTSQERFSQLAPYSGEGLLAQILTLIEGGGTLTHDPNTLGRVSWSQDLKVRPLGTSKEVTVRAGSIDLGEDEIAFVQLSNPFRSTTLSMQKALRSNQGLTSMDRYWVFHRTGSVINVRGGLQLELGEKRQLDDIVIGNSVFFSNDDRIRFSETDNTFCFDADGGSNNGNIALGEKLFFGDPSNSDLIQFSEGAKPALRFLTNNIARVIIDELGDLIASRDVKARRHVHAKDALTGTGAEYQKANGTAVVVNASLNEVHDETIARKLLKITPNNPNNSSVNIASSQITAADGSQFSLATNGSVVSYPGGTVNFSTGVVTGGGSNFTPYRPTVLSRYFKYGLALNSSQELVVILPTSDATTASGAANPSFGSDLPIGVVTVQDNGDRGSGTIRSIGESSLVRFIAAGGGGESPDPPDPPPLRGVLDSGFILSDGTSANNITHITTVFDSGLGRNVSEITPVFDWVPGLHPGKPNGDLIVKVEGVELPRAYAGLSSSKTMYYTEIPGATPKIRISERLSAPAGPIVSIHVQRRQGTTDTKDQNRIDIASLKSSVEPYDSIVGSSNDVTNGLATHSSLTQSITALSAGDTILVLKSYVPPSGSTIAINKKLTIKGQGHGTNITAVGQAMTISANYCELEGLRWQGNITVSSKGCFLKGWRASGTTLTNSGTGNTITAIEES